jgi:hypothetical protein
VDVVRNWDVLTLDHTGNTIPATYHAPDDPDGAVFMATNGDDKNDGRSEDRPVKTLNRAIDVAPNKGTVCFRGGTYNDNYHAADGSYRILSNKFLTFTSYLGEPVVFDGGGRLHHLIVCGSTIGVGMHAFKGFQITNFVGDWGGAIGDVPLYLGDGQGAWYAIEDMLINKNAGCGVNLSDPRGDLGDCRVVRTVFCDNGSDGLTDTGSQKPLKPTGPTSEHVNDWWVSHCYFGRNNKQNFQHPYEAGAKLHNNNKVTCFGNIVEDTVGNYGHGLWTDVANRDARYICNFVRRCGSSGLFDEVGQYAWFVSNILVDNGLEVNHANIRVASEKPRIWYNTSVTTPSVGYLPIEIYDDVRNPTSDGYGANTQGVELSSNLLVGPGRYSFLMYLYANQPPHVGGGTQPEDFWTPPGKWSKNAWYTGGKNMVRWGSGSYFKTPAEIQANKGVGGSDILLTDDPFVDRKKWRVKPSSPAYATGDPLPADIAEVLGYPAGSRFPRGYIDCPLPTW